MNDFDERLRKLIHMERHNFAGSSSRAIVELVNLLFDFANKNFGAHGYDSRFPAARRSN